MPEESSWLARIISKGIEWVRVPMEPNDHDARGFTGTCDEWRFVVASFSIEDQGFPRGSRGYDGTAVQYGCVMHLRLDQAEVLCRDAESKISS